MQNLTRQLVNISNLLIKLLLNVSFLGAKVNLVTTTLLSLNNNFGITNSSFSLLNFDIFICKPNRITSMLGLILIVKVSRDLLGSMQVTGNSITFRITQLTFTCSKLNNRNTRKSCEISSKLTIKTLRQWRRCDVFIVNFEHISNVFYIITIADFEQVNVSWLGGSLELQQIGNFVHLVNTCLWMFSFFIIISLF